jgi:hypothetical protein
VKNNMDLGGEGAVTEDLQYWDTYTTRTRTVRGYAKDGVILTDCAKI